MARRKVRPNDVAFVLALVAGILILFAGYNGARRLDAILDAIAQFVGPNPAFRILSFVLLALASLGGALVIVAGILIRKDRVRMGRFLITLGTGFSVLGLILFIVTNLEREHIPLVQGFGPGAAGVILSVAARLTSKVPERRR